MRESQPYELAMDEHRSNLRSPTGNDPLLMSLIKIQDEQKSKIPEPLAKLAPSVNIAQKEKKQSVKPPVIKNIKKASKKKRR